MEVGSLIRHQINIYGLMGEKLKSWGMGHAIFFYFKFILTNRVPGAGLCRRA